MHTVFLFYRPSIEQLKERWNECMELSECVTTVTQPACHSFPLAACQEIWRGERTTRTFERTLAGRHEPVYRLTGSYTLLAALFWRPSLSASAPSALEPKRLDRLRRPRRHRPSARVE